MKSRWPFLKVLLEDGTLGLTEDGDVAIRSYGDRDRAVQKDLRRLVRAESGKAKGGRWSVERDQLCLLKPEISTTQPACFSVHRRGNELQYLDGQQLVYQGFLKRSS